MNTLLAYIYPHEIIFLQLLLALLLGMTLGVQRTLSGKNAGMRTYSLVSMGCAMLVIIAQSVIATYPAKTNFDPLSLAGSVMQGIGFLGAGLIIFHGSKINGLTTAAGIWMAAVIGLAVGYKMYEVAIFATVVTLIVFTLIWTFETKIRKLYADDVGSDESDSESEKTGKKM